jgi:hypothetical protein
VPLSLIEPPPSAATAQQDDIFHTNQGVIHTIARSIHIRKIIRQYLDALPLLGIAPWPLSETNRMHSNSEVLADPFLQLTPDTAPHFVQSWSKRKR